MAKVIHNREACVGCGACALVCPRNIITMVPFKEMVYIEERAQYVPADEVGKDEKVLNISGTEFRRRLNEGLEIPEWFSFPKVVEELRKKRDYEELAFYITKHLMGVK